MGGRAVLLAIALILTGAAPAAATCKLQKVADLPVTMIGFQPTIQTQVNGAPATLIADTGAFFSLLNSAAAAKLKLDREMLAPGFYLQGATGRVAPDLGSAKTFVLGGVTLRRADFLIVDGYDREVDGYLGQNLMGHFDTEYDLANGVIRLWTAEDCRDTPLAYWAKDLPLNVIRFEPTTPQQPQIIGDGAINGHAIRVLLDTGASNSGLKLSTAKRLGLDLNGPGVRAGGVMRGIGWRGVESWMVPVDSLAIGQETIKNTRIRVAAEELDVADMLLGADFFLSHRVLISHAQRKVYFTYNGGPVFKLDPGDLQQAEHQLRPAEPAAGVPPTPAPDNALDAAALSRRAAASAVRGDFARAEADLGAAIKLEPTQPRRYAERARVRLRASEPVLAMADLDEALKLDPHLVDALLLRGELRLMAKDADGAEADFQGAAKQAPDDPQLAGEIAAAYSHVGRFERAIAYYDDWIARYPKDPRLPDVLNGRCWARALWGRELDKAVADCDAALRRGQRLAAYLDSRGLAHLRRGELDLAITDYDQALKLQPKLPWSLYGRGLAKAKKGDAAGSVADIAAAEALAPGIRKEAQRYGVTEQTAVVAQAS